ncbi:MAG: T9SS type A sorting domain-containing protein, partial [bacterium]
GAWFEVMPTFRNTRLFTAAKSEQLIFEVRTRDIFGFAGTASAPVVVQSNNDMVLDRNVFEADREGPLQIKFKLSSNRHARLEVYDLAGHHVTTLSDAPYAAGWNTHSWNGFITERGYPAGSGVYLITLRAGEYDDWKKVIIVR